jgi:peptide/nickel transport system substrate-binding protein
VQRPEFRQAISHAVDRQQFADTVYLGAAEPLWGPVTRGNPGWYWDGVPTYPYGIERARALLRSIGLEDRNGNGVVEDRAGTEARFVVLTQRGVSHYERATQFLRDELGKAGIALEIAPLDVATLIGRLLEPNYDAIYYRFLLTDLDPALAKDFWFSSGSARVWNLAQASPSTEWERRVDALMAEQVAVQDPSRRREIFNEVQRLFAENLPILHFAAPRLYFAHSARLRGVSAATLRPNVLWNADTLNVAGAGPGTE